jgi:hypothetical protein
VAFRDSSSGNVTNTQSPVITRPATAVEGDVVLVCIGTNDLHVATAPAGWTQIGTTQDAGAADTSVSVLYRVVEASPPASWTLTTVFDALETGFYGAVAYSGRDTTSPINTSSQAAPSSANEQESDSITPSVSGCDVVVLAGRDPDAAGETSTPSASTTGHTGTERVDGQNGTNGGVYILDAENVADAAIQLAWTMDAAATDAWGVFAVAIKSAAAAAVLVPPPIRRVF